MTQPVIRHYLHYHCTKRRDRNCTQGVIGVNELETQIDSFLAKVGISEEFKNWAIKYLNELNDDETETRNASLTAIQEAYNGCVKRLDNLVQLKICPQNSDSSLLTDEEFKAQKKTIMAEKAG